jgi:hypothetical protein
MKNNTFKRVLAGSLALLTVAAYVPANVGGILPDLAIVASAVDDVTDDNLLKLDEDAIFDVDEDTVPFIEGVYEITTNAGKYVYGTPKTGSDIYKLTKDKAYVLRTTAYLDAPVGLEKNEFNKDLNGDALPDGVYEYVVQVGAASQKLVAKTVAVGAVGFNTNEKLTVVQNNEEIKYENGAFTVAAGFPVEVSATPGETHTNQMLTVDEYADAKSQKKEGTTLTLTIVPTGEDDVEISWTDYKPILQLTNDNGNIRATDVGFNKLIENAVIGTYEFKFGEQSGTTFTAGSTNAKGEYVADTKSEGVVVVTAKPVTVGKTTYTFLETSEDADPTTATVFTDKKTKDPVDDTKGVGTYVATTTFVLTEDATLASEFKIEKEFTVAEATGVSKIEFKAIKSTALGAVPEVIDPEQGTGIYSVPWTGNEIVPELTLYKPDGENTYVEGTDYTLTGSTKATDIGTYTMTINPKKKDFNEGKTIEITWKIVDSNSYVEFKNKTQLNDEENPVFTIGFRQASTASIKEQILKKLKLVGSQDLTVVKYTNEDNRRVDDPSATAGKYIAYVANALQNDGKTSAMRKNNTLYTYIAGDPDGDAEFLEEGGTGLFKVYFEVTPTQIQILPTVTEITYGDDVKLNNLYKVLDFATKEEIGVPWATGQAPKIYLTGKNGEIAQDGKESTDRLPAGEYTYMVEATPLDEQNYDVLVYGGENLDPIDFTVNPRNLKDLKFDVAQGTNIDVDGSVRITKSDIARAANKIVDNPVMIGLPKDEKGLIQKQDLDRDGELDYDENTTDFVIAGGTTSVKSTDDGKTFTVSINGTGNFTGSAKVSWMIDPDKLNDGVLTYEAEFDASKPRVMAKFNTKNVDGEIDECGFYFNNNGKLKDLDVDEDQIQEAVKQVLKQADKEGAYQNQYNCKKVTFTNKAVSTALSGNGLLTAEIANSSVEKQVYIMPYVKYSNGNVAYGKVEKFNYYDMVLNAEGALEMTKTDVIGDGKTGTAGQTYAKIDVTRVNKKGYEVERYGILYNNSDTWDNAPVDSVDDDADADQKEAYATTDEMALAYRWLQLDHESEKTVKVAEVDKEDLATKIGTNTYIANTTAKDYNGGKVKTDYGYGAKTVFARAFIQIKDAAGNSKVYYSHLADVTYGGFTVDNETGAVNGVEAYIAGGKAILDANNKSQILFYAPTSADFNVEDVYNDVDYDQYEDEKDGVKVLDADETTPENMTRMNASTGNKTFQVWWTDSKKS